MRVGNGENDMAEHDISDRNEKPDRSARGSDAKALAQALVDARTATLSRLASLPISRRSDEQVKK